MIRLAAIERYYESYGNGSFSDLVAKILGERARSIPLGSARREPTRDPELLTAVRTWLDGSRDPDYLEQFLAEKKSQQPSESASGPSVPAVTVSSRGVGSALFPQIFQRLSINDLNSAKPVTGPIMQIRRQMWDYLSLPQLASSFSTLTFEGAHGKGKTALTKEMFQWIESQLVIKTVFINCVNMSGPDIKDMERTFATHDGNFPLLVVFDNVNDIYQGWVKPIFELLEQHAADLDSVGKLDSLRVVFISNIAVPSTYSMVPSFIDNWLAHYKATRKPQQQNLPWGVKPPPDLRNENVFF
jgi:hypothetical protein